MTHLWAMVGTMKCRCFCRDMLLAADASCHRSSASTRLPNCNALYFKKTCKMAQMRTAPAPPPLHAPAPQQQHQQHHDALGSLDTAALGRLLAANQALVQQQVCLAAHSRCPLLSTCTTPSLAVAACLGEL